MPGLPIPALEACEAFMAHEAASTAARVASRVALAIGTPLRGGPSPDLELHTGGAATLPPKDDKILVGQVSVNYG